jgi:hypothetical protein
MHCTERIYANVDLLHVTPASAFDACEIMGLLHGYIDKGPSIKVKPDEFVKKSPKV